MLRITPPSARTDAPLMAADWALATNATTAAISSGVSKRLRSELGRADLKNSFSISAGERPFFLAKLSRKPPAPSEAVGAGEDGVHRDAGAGNRFGEAASYGDLRGLGHTVVNHFRRNLKCGFAGNEN